MNVNELQRLCFLKYRLFSEYRNIKLTTRFNRNTLMRTYALVELLSTQPCSISMLLESVWYPFGCYTRLATPLNCFWTKGLLLAPKFTPRSSLPFVHRPYKLLIRNHINIDPTKIKSMLYSWIQYRKCSKRFRKKDFIVADDDTFLAFAINILSNLSCESVYYTFRYCTKE